MTMRRGLIAAVALLAFGVSAKADYSFSTVVTINNEVVTGPSTGGPFPAPFTNPIVTITGESGGPLIGDNTPATASISLANTNPSTGPANTVTIDYTEEITIVNPLLNLPGTTFKITGTLTVSNFTAESAVSHNVYTSISPSGPTNVGGTMFTLFVPTGVQDVDFEAPTVNGGVFGAGGLSAEILITSVPEPGSMALIGIGITGMIGYGWRRREVARRSNLA